MSKQEVIICHNLEENLNKAITQCPHDKLFVLADEHTRKLCIPVLSGFDCIKNAHFIYIGAEDVHKNLEHWHMYGKSWEIKAQAVIRYLSI